MPWSCRILLQHHQTKKFKCHCSDLMLKLFLKYMPRCENPRNSWILHFCVVRMDLWSKFSNFKHLQKINEGKDQSGLKVPSELCFGIMNTKDSYLLNSNWKGANMRQESVLFLYGEVFLKSYKKISQKGKYNFYQF